MGLFNRNKDYVLEYEKAVKQHLNGKISYKKLEAAYAKFIKAQKKETGGAQMDFYDVEGEKARREKNFRAALRNVDMVSLDAKGWKKVKKEADIKKSPFLKKADANVSKFLTAYQKAYDRFLKSAPEHPEGDTKLAGELLMACSNLDKALDNFVKSKEFKTALAQDLRDLCVDMRGQLARDMKSYAQIASDRKLAQDQMKATLLKAGLKL